MQNEIKNLTMAKKLRILREIAKLSQLELAGKLNVSEKTISAWETEEREINLNNAKIIAEYFNVPNSFFVFNDNFDKIDDNLKKQILNQMKDDDFFNKINIIIQMCKSKLESDSLPIKKEYLPVFDYENRTFISTGLFQSPCFSIQTKNESRNFININQENYPYKILSEDKISDTSSYEYNTEALNKFALYDIFYKYNSEKAELQDLVNCNNLEIIKQTLEKAKKKNLRKQDYWGRVSGPTTEEYVEEQLNYLLENLNPSLSNFWQIIIFLIDSGAFYQKQTGKGSDVVCFYIEKDISKTNLVYRLAKDMIKINF